MSSLGKQFDLTSWEAAIIQAQGEQARKSPDISPSALINLDLEFLLSDNPWYPSPPIDQLDTISSSALINLDVELPLSDDLSYPLFSQDDKFGTTLSPPNEYSVESPRKPRKRVPRVPPIIVDDPNDTVAMKRARNTLAARKSRLKRLQKLEEAEEQRSIEMGPSSKLRQTSNVAPVANLVPATTSEIEDYTIKCICEWHQDDGATIYCESCDTWQHIECFYPGQMNDASRADFQHSCADCSPRALDRQRAIEYQQTQQQLSVHRDNVKSKRLPSKVHKKKAKSSSQ